MCVSQQKNPYLRLLTSENIFSNYFQMLIPWKRQTLKTILAYIQLSFWCQAWSPTTSKSKIHESLRDNYLVWNTRVRVACGLKRKLEGAELMHCSAGFGVLLNLTSRSFYGFFLMGRWSSSPLAHVKIDYRNQRLLLEIVSTFRVLQVFWILHKYFYCNTCDFEQRTLIIRFIVSLCCTREGKHHYSIIHSSSRRKVLENWFRKCSVLEVFCC